ncbi:MAG TPA: hypothetical protein VD816_11555 [Ohtaekwangia sp.]|nr:hypothetical protein [Ohtaekwangia sp.]
MIRLMIFATALFLAGVTNVSAQKIDAERMQRDIEVAENILGTLIKQQFNNQRTFFPLEINGTYQPGSGVTFTLPADFTTPIIFSGGNDVIVWGSESNRQTFRFNVENGNDISPANGVNERPVPADPKTENLGDRVREKKRLDMDSIRETYNIKVIEAAKLFMVDYGDMITQLNPEEKITVTNQGNQPRVWVNHYFNAPKRTHLTIETVKSDLASYKQSKLTRDQLLARIKVINTQTIDEVEPDLELLTSIFNRLYRADLSKTYFTEDNIYYEHLKDFGAVFYMQVFSSYERGFQRYVMPTLRLDNLDLEAKNKKVAELYPKFEQDLKENILEYGRTLKSLKDDEILVFQIQVTRCQGCNIPSTLELSIKSTTLKQFNDGKIDKNAALSLFTLKKGTNQ